VTIERGRDWGWNAPLPPGSPVAAGDAELYHLLNAPMGSAGGVDRGLIVGLVAGALCRTVGGRGDRARLDSDEAMTLPCDVLELSIEGHRVRAGAHVVCRRSGRLGWWRGPVVAVMNAQFVGDWDVAPRSHPNDGRAEVIETSMATAERLKARHRLRLGTHVPHPEIRQRSVAVVTLEFGEPLMVWADGVAICSTSAIVVTVLPDALHIVV
jgi:hypothetical protein